MEKHMTTLSDRQIEDLIHKWRLHSPNQIQDVSKRSQRQIEYDRAIDSVVVDLRNALEKENLANRTEEILSRTERNANAEIAKQLLRVIVVPIAALLVGIHFYVPNSSGFLLVFYLIVLIIFMAIQNYKLKVNITPPIIAIILGFALLLINYWESFSVVKAVSESVGNLGLEVIGVAIVGLFVSVLTKKKTMIPVIFCIVALIIGLLMILFGGLGNLTWGALGIEALGAGVTALLLEAIINDLE
jgi:hypothetical protein